MNLVEPLQLEHGELIALIGAGGKTTTMFHLARELRERGQKVLTTTTTKIFKPTKPHVDRLFLVEDPAQLEAICASINAPAVVGIGHHLEADGKLTGIPAHWIEELARKQIFDTILVEADGAASRHLKVPSGHEPVIPSLATLTLWLMSIKVIGKPLTSDWVHRSNVAAALLGVPIGTAVTAEMIRALLRQPQGCLKGIPDNSRRIAVINQADSPAEIAAAQLLAPKINACGFEKVLITSHGITQPALAPSAHRQQGVR